MIPTQKKQKYDKIITEFKLFRLNRGWSGVQTSLKLGCSHQHYNAIERGKANPSDKLIKDMIFLMKMMGE